MKLDKILTDVNVIEVVGKTDIDIKSLSHNSSKVEKNSLFFCIRGFESDGHDFGLDAVTNGAICLVVEKKLDINCTQIIVDDSRIAMSIISKNFFKNPQKNLKIIALVGTNGKTTTSFIIDNILKENNKNVGIIGTNGIYIDNIKLPNSFTTPDPIELYYTLNQMVSFNIEYVILETTAHAIKLNKLIGLDFEVGVFTNITNEHLDFFDNMENYSLIKLNFLNDKNKFKEIVVNVDDAYGKKLAQDTVVPCITYGIINPANVFAIDVKYSFEKMNFMVNINDEILKIESKIIGDYNVYNLMSGITVGKICGCSNDQIIKGIKKLNGVSGRFEVFKFGLDKKVIVDFAHTPDGIEKCLGLVKSLVKGKIISLLGCVEYSDILKREKMGEVVSGYSDYIILTADNPNFENVTSICNSIKKGISKNKKVFIIEDRMEAVKFGLKLLNTGDTLVLLGKGGETKQRISGKDYYYDEVEFVKTLIGNN